MRRLIVSTFVSLDGIMQAPGGPEEDPPPTGLLVRTERFNEITGPSSVPLFCRFRNNRSTDAGALRNLLIERRQMATLSTFCETILFSLVPAVGRGVGDLNVGHHRACDSGLFIRSILIGKVS